MVNLFCVIHPTVPWTVVNLRKSGHTSRTTNPETKPARRTKAAVSTPLSHGGLEALVAPDHARQEGRAKSKSKFSMSATRAEPPIEALIGQLSQPEDPRLILSLFLFFQQSGYRRSDFVHVLWVAEEFISDGAPGCLFD